jgi:molybdate transport system permease protein
MPDATPFILSLKLALVSTLLLLLIGIPIASWLGRTRSRWTAPIEAIVSLPLILPPTVLGFYLLLLFSPQSSFGSLLEDSLGLQLAFRFEGLVLASLIYGLPFMIRPLTAGFRSLPSELTETAGSLGFSRLKTLFRVQLPNMRDALISGAVLTFAHTVGEFGVVLMIGGNIPDETRVASVALFNEVEAMNYGSAHLHAVILLTFSFLVLLSVQFLSRPQKLL